MEIYSIRPPSVCHCSPCLCVFLPRLRHHLSEKTSRGDQSDGRNPQQHLMGQYEQTEYDHACGNQKHSQSRSVLLFPAAGPFSFSASHVPVSSLHFICSFFLLPARERENSPDVSIIIICKDRGKRHCRKGGRRLSAFRNRKTRGTEMTFSKITEIRR